MCDGKWEARIGLRTRKTQGLCERSRPKVLGRRVIRFVVDTRQRGCGMGQGWILDVRLQE